MVFLLHVTAKILELVALQGSSRVQKRAIKFLCTSLSMFQIIPFLIIPKSGLIGQIEGAKLLPSVSVRGMIP